MNGRQRRFPASVLGGAPRCAVPQAGWLTPAADRFRRRYCRHLLPLKVGNLSLRIVNDDSEMGTVEFPYRLDGRRSRVARGGGGKNDVSRRR